MNFTLCPLYACVCRYVESGVTITDVSTVDLKRRFTTDYSAAEALMIGDYSGFVKKCGTYSITYELATPWIKGRAKASITRLVDVVDANECEYKGADHDFLHMCNFPAKCVNVACGTQGFAPDEPAYECVCEHPDYEPDGDHGCRLKEVASPDPSPQEEEPDLSFYAKLHEAFEHIQWHEDKLHVNGVRGSTILLTTLK